MCHVFGGMKHKAKVSVLIMSLYSCATEDKLLAVRLAGFKYHNFCFAEVDCELAQFTEDLKPLNQRMSHGHQHVHIFGVGVT